MVGVGVRPPCTPPRLFRPDLRVGFDLSCAPRPEALGRCLQREACLGVPSAQGPGLSLKAVLISAAGRRRSSPRPCSEGRPEARRGALTALFTRQQPDRDRASSRQARQTPPPFASLRCRGSTSPERRRHRSEVPRRRSWPEAARVRKKSDLDFRDGAPGHEIAGNSLVMSRSSVLRPVPVDRAEHLAAVRPAVESLSL